MKNRFTKIAIIILSSIVFIILITVPILLSEYKDDNSLTDDFSQSEGSLNLESRSDDNNSEAKNSITDSTQSPLTSAPDTSGTTNNTTGTTSSQTQKSTTTKAPQTTPGTTTQQKSELSFAKEVLRLCNVERINNGLPALLWSDTAGKAADIRSQEIVTNFSHTRPNGQKGMGILTDYGINHKAVGENIACGQQTPAQVVSSWMNSEGHRANILSPNFTHLGVGYYYSNNASYRHYWTQLFYA